MGWRHEELPSETFVGLVFVGLVFVGLVFVGLVFVGQVETLDLRANPKLREVTLKAKRRLSTIHCAERQEQTIPGLRKFFKLSKPTKNPAKMDAYYPELAKQRAIPEHMIELSAVATHA